MGWLEKCLLREVDIEEDEAKSRTKPIGYWYEVVTEKLAWQGKLNKLQYNRAVECAQREVKIPRNNFAVI